MFKACHFDGSISSLGDNCEKERSIKALSRESGETRENVVYCNN